MSEDPITRDLETTPLEVTTLQLSLYQVIQKSFQILEAVQKALDIEPASHHNQVNKLEPRNELIELESEPEIISPQTGHQLYCEKYKTYTVEELAQEKSYLANFQAENFKKRAENYNKFLEAQSKFAKSKAIFETNQTKFSSIRQYKSF
ncbi:hypothetical protein SD80_024905 [Scytonema tolypothrichoides VB-61278]|nr:hypothetical protein SD80_024905 [Scytonema tolypothrichoides VB-61278]